VISTEALAGSQARAVHEFTGRQGTATLALQTRERKRSVAGGHDDTIGAG
jgi:hypothetical protein